MAKDKNPLDGVVKFLQMEGREGELQQLLLAHVLPACVAMKVEPEALPAELEPQVYAMMVTCVVEDLVTRPGEDGQTIMETYLKRHGWKLNGLAKRQLEALIGSQARLYEIASVKAGEGFAMRDLLAPDETVEVWAPALSGALPVGCPLGARVIKVDGVTQVSGGILPFEEGMGTEAANAVGEAATDNLAPAITAHWLLKSLQEKFAKPADTIDAAED